MLKQVVRAVVVSALVLFAASPAWANGLGVVLDPIIGSGGPGIYLIFPGAPFTIPAWQNCTAPPLAPGSPLKGDNACLAFLNDTGANIPSLDLSFKVPSGFPLIGQPITCSNAPGDVHLTTHNCTGGNLFAGETVNLDFSGGQPIPANFAFYIGVTGAGITPSNLPLPGLTLPDYDLGTAMLLLAGMSMLAMAGVRRSA